MPLSQNLERRVRVRPTVLSAILDCATRCTVSPCQEQRARTSACQHARARGVDRLHPSMRSRIWQPGVSGNPTGRGGLYLECRRLAAEASPEAMRRLIELMAAEDERVSYMATTAVLDRAGVKPIDYDPSHDQVQPSWDPGALTDEEREDLKALLVKMIGKGKA